jgi:hypothetical protein
LSLLKYDTSLPLNNGTYAGITNPVVALGNVQVQRCDEKATEKGLCITFAQKCALSLCARQFETSVVNGTANITITDEDYGCLSKVHDDKNTVAFSTSTHCWQAGKPCGKLNLTDLTDTYSFENRSYPGLNFCLDGIVVQDSQFHKEDSYDSIMATRSIQSNTLPGLIGNQTASLDCDLNYRYEWRDGDITYRWCEGDITPSSYAMEYIAVNGLEPVLAGVAASLTQQALLANTSVEEMGIVWTTETFVAVDWPWLIYPATLVLAAIILLILTAIHSHRCGLRIWKSSMLPLLYRTLDPDLLVRQQVLHDVSTMTSVAGRAKVTLVKTSREDVVVLTQ